MRDSGVLARTGEMGRRVAAFEWSTTELGSPERWPRTFHATIQTLLGSRYPMILLWGSELLQFYNDAYIGLIGAKHPDALGRSIKVTQAESWDAIGPMIHEVMSTGIPNWVPAQRLPLLRHGYLEESYFSLSYSAVDDDDGIVRGMLCVCSEVTEQIVGARRMKLLRAVAVGTGDTRSSRATANEVMRILGEHALDVPFAALYLAMPGGSVFELCGSTDGSPSDLFPHDIAGETRHPIWPFTRALAGETVLVGDLDRHLEHPAGPFGDRTRHALLMPLGSPGRGDPLGLLVAAVSPARSLDDDYRTFYELLAGQVETSVRSSIAFEQERERAEALAELDRAKTTFFTNVSHEFRTPLTLILGPIEDAMRLSSGSLQGESLYAVHRSAIRLLHLVNSLLDFARLESGQLQTTFAPTDVAMLTTELASSFRFLVEDAGLALTVECPPLSERVFVDASHWEKIVLNLLSNAFKYTLRGGIVVALRERERCVELSVADTGIGVPAEGLPRMFERFHRVEGAVGRSFEGTGIGLSLVHELSRLHGGSVAVSSVLGEGTTFVVSIPLGSDHLPPERVVASASGTDASASAPSQILFESAQWNARATEVSPARSDAALVLVADDNADMRDYLVRLLAGHWRVEAVPDGEAALARALQETPDLVLSDVMMPRLDGIGLLQRLRADPRTRNVPVVLLSARAGEEALLEGLDTGADDYLVKPFSSRELLARVRTHLEMARLRREWAAELDRANRELRRVNEELETFSYSVSHDLRTPLRAIDGFSKVLVHEHAAQLDAEATRYLGRIRAGAQRMGLLIEDLLRLSQIARPALVCERVDLTDLARAVVAELEAREPDRQVEIRIAESLVVQADARLVSILLENLLGNAWKFSSRAAPARIEVGSEERDGARVFFVRDNGAGFDMKYTKRLFTPFQRLHNASEFPGTGIGLATVQRIVRRHNGAIWAEAALGEGATFFFRLGDPS